MSASKFSEVIDNLDNLDELIQKLPLAVAAINLNREIVGYNRAFFLMAGRELRQGTRHCYEFLNFPFCQSDCLAHMATRLGRTVTWDESRGSRRDGEELIVRPTVIPLKNINGEIHGHILVFQNTTDEVHLYRNFRANLDHLERKVAFLQTLNEAADEFRKIKQVETLLQKITEFAVQNLSVECCQWIQAKPESTGFQIMQTSQAAHCQLQEHHKQLLLESLLGQLEQSSRQSAPVQICHFDEQGASVAGQSESILFPIRSGTSDYGFFVTHRFTAQEKTSTEQLEYLQLFAKSLGPYIENCHIIANLELIVAERTSQLQSTQAQLLESTRLASVGEMAGMVAHEVLNPMTAILARVRKVQEDDSSVGLIKFILEAWRKDYADGGIQQLLEVLQSIPDGGQVPLVEEDLTNLYESVSDLKKDMKFVEEQLNRIVSIVDNLRGLSRAQNSTQLVDVRDPIFKTAELTKDGLLKRNIKLIQEFHHTSQVVCDPNELIQVIHNLVRNSMQAIERNGTIIVSTNETPERLEIRIADSGPGIPAEVVSKIFEMRFTTKSAQEGTGLGLNLSRRLMRQVLGDLDLESPGGYGAGAVFLCWLPKERRIP